MGILAVGIGVLGLVHPIVPGSGEQIFGGAIAAIGLLMLVMAAASELRKRRKHSGE